MQQCDIPCWPFLLMCLYKRQSFVFLKNDNFNSLLWDYYLFSFWLLLAIKLAIRITERSEKVWEGCKNFAKLIMWSLCSLIFLLLTFKMFCSVLFYIEFLFNMFEFIWDTLHGLARQLRHECLENMHEVRFPNIYILSHIYFIHPLAMFALAIKAAGFLQCIMVISKIKYEFF